MNNKWMDKLFQGIDYFTGILTGLMVLFVFLNVVLRTFFNSGLTWSEELSRYLFVCVTYIGAISAMRSKAHLGVDILMARVSPRLQFVFYMVSQAIILMLMVVLTVGAGAMTLQNTRSTTAALGIPYALLYFFGVITGVSIGILAVANMIYAIRHPAQISEIVVMQNSEDDDIAAEAMENAEDLTDEEYMKRLQAEGEK